MLRSAAGLVRRPLQYLSPTARRSRRMDAAFDARYGTDTAGKLAVAALQLPHDRRADAVHYQASRDETLLAPLRALALDLRDWHFVDYGAGKGRMVMVAAESGFASATGVELSPVLCRIAERNFALFAAASPDVAAPSIVQADAAGFVPAGERLVAYLYNPFGAATLRALLERLASAPAREIVLIYAEPVHAGVIDLARWDVSAFSPATLIARRR